MPIPLRLDSRPHASHAARRLENRLAEAAGKLRGARVLLVEDNEISQAIALQVLKRADLEVDLAVDGGQAVEKVSSTDYDAVLMDWQLPTMDGSEAARRIRSDPRNAKLPILALTSNDLAYARTQCLAAGMNDCLAKPLNIGQFLEALIYWMPRHALQPEDEFARLPGVDARSALARLGGKLPLYRKLLTTFAKNHANAHTEVREAWRAGDIELAQRLAHTMKGIAGNVGAQSLMRKFQDIEAALPRGDADQVNRLLDGLSEPHTALVRAIEAMLPTQAPAMADGVPPPTPLDMEQWAQDARALAFLLADSDARSGALAEQMSTQLAPAALELFAPVVSAIRIYEFDAALTALTTMAKSMKIELS
jgi:CheY-like chemotaxis protein